jgi:hypothetical protein
MISSFRVDLPSFEWIDANHLLYLHIPATTDEEAMHPHIFKAADIHNLTINEICCVHQMLGLHGGNMWRRFTGDVEYSPKGVSDNNKLFHFSGNDVTPSQPETESIINLTFRSSPQKPAVSLDALGLSCVVQGIYEPYVFERVHAQKQGSTTVFMETTEFGKIHVYTWNESSASSNSCLSHLSRNFALTDSITIHASASTAKPPTNINSSKPILSPKVIPSTTAGGGASVSLPSPVPVATITLLMVVFDGESQPRVAKKDTTILSPFAWIE